MTSRPVLGIICCTRMIGKASAQAVLDRYVTAAMKYADTNALLIPALPDLSDAGDIVARLDGLLLTGSPSNVEPQRYGDAEGDGPFDPARDEMVLRLVDSAASRMAPIFGVCRGFQELNVALGGTLRRDTSAVSAPFKHHAPAGASYDEMFDHRHEVSLVPGGILARAYGETALSINSVHFQGVAKLAPSLTVEALAPDGLVEGFSSHQHGAPLVAVQWHPEWRTDDNRESQTFFKLLGRALRGDMLTGDK
jgi:putative glutamine amidotransferase